jgi:hypothetical protein
VKNCGILLWLWKTNDLVEELVGKKSNGIAHAHDGVVFGLVVVFSILKMERKCDLA